MKKLTLFLLFALSLTAAFSQTITKSIISPSGDTTTVIVTTTPSVLNYATLNQAAVSLTNGGLPLSISPASLNQATMTQGTTTVQLFFKPYKAPVTVTPTPVTTSTTVGSIASGPIILQSGKTYAYLTIDLGNTSKIGIYGLNASGFTVKKCKIINGTGSGTTWATAIFLQGCTNFTIDSCFISNVPQGILVKACPGAKKITNNQLLNILNCTTLTMHPIQLQGCNGGGQLIANNRIQEDPLIAPYTHDQISIYQSNGLPGDSIQVINNWIMGGQQIKNATGTNGACAIGVGDSGGSYQVVRGNKTLNALAIAIDGTGTSLKVDHNYVYAQQVSPQPASVGIVYLGSPGNNFVGYNHINFRQPNGSLFNLNPPTSSTIQGWGTNVYDPALSVSLLPQPFITFK